MLFSRNVADLNFINLKLALILGDKPIFWAGCQCECMQDIVAVAKFKIKANEARADAANM